MKKKWFTTLIIFIAVQLVFFIIDGTRFEPKLNDSGNIMSRYAHLITESKLVTERFTIYSYPYFNFVTIVFIVIVMINLLYDFIYVNLKKY